MGSTMKPTIFNDKVATALRSWHQTAKKHIKETSKQATPASSRPATPSRGTSPIHLLKYHSQFDSLQTSPKKSNLDIDQWDGDDSPSPSWLHHRGDSSFHHQIELADVEFEEELRHEPSSSQVAPLPHHEINISRSTKEFSFDKRDTT